jgi:hypothetical protein
MNNESTRTQFFAGEHVSESTVRGILRPRRRTRPTTPTEPARTGATDHPTVSQNPSASADGLQPRRRWSVAALIARAVAAPPPTA